MVVPTNVLTRRARRPIMHVILHLRMHVANDISESKSGV